MVVQSQDIDAHMHMNVRTFEHFPLAIAIPSSRAVQPYSPACPHQRLPYLSLLYSKAIAFPRPPQIAIIIFRVSTSAQLGLIASNSRVRAVNRKLEL